MNRPLANGEAHRARIRAELEEFVRIPSVSADPARATDVRRCAEWLADHLRRIGLPTVTIVPIARHPVVCAASARRADRPTVLVYGHYDVQPADPLDQWRTPPFEPTVRDEHLYGRGACDDKGQLFAHLKALESYHRAGRPLPTNVVCVFEGGEEIGSPHLRAFLLAHRRQLAADVAVISDTRMLGPDRPAITYATRGGLGLEVEVRGPSHDLHSGNFGGVVHNPLQALSEIVAALHDSDGRIAIPGLYDRVRRWPAEERAYMRRVGPSAAEILRDAGTDVAWGGRGWSLYERLTIRPALTINGLTGGYQGPGGKAVIPARATAKLSFRLVPDQDPREVERLVRAHLRRLSPPTVRLAVKTNLRARPAVVDRRHAAMRAAALAYRHGFGAAPVFVRSGGTLPVVSMLEEVLGLPTVLMGFALPDSALHAPNERLHLPTFFRGITTCACFLAAIAAQGRIVARRAA